MKLSKRFLIIYSIAGFTAIIICSCFFLGFKNGAHSGELLRSSEISIGVKSTLEHYLHKIDQTKSIYVNTLDNIPLQHNLESINFLIPKDKNLYDLDYKIIVDSKNHKNSKYVLSNKETEDSKYDNIVDLVIESISTTNTTTFTGLINYENLNFIVSYSPLTMKSNNLDLLILISEITDVHLNYFGSSTSSDLTFSNNLNIDTGNIYSSNIKGKSFNFRETKDKIYCYIPIYTLNSTDPLYLEVEQSKEVQQTITSKFFIFMISTLVLFFIVNFILFKIIQTTIIKRILNLNKQLYEVDGNNLSILSPTSTKINDEITDLSTEISNMVTRISSSTDALKDNELKNRKIIDTMTNGFIYCKSIVNSNNIVVDGEILDMNFSAKTLFNIDVITNKLLSSTDEAFSNSDFISHINSSLRDKKIGTTYEIKFNNTNWAIVSINSIFDGYFFIVINDVTTLKSYSEEMKHIATYDALTSIFNRRKLIEHAENLVKNNIPYSLFFIDLDNFKKVNDTLGHDEGDVILKGVSSDLSKLLCKDIKIGRLGGDEFVVIKEGTHSPNEIIQFGDLINKTISKEYLFKSLKFDLQSSIGVASYPLDSKINSTVMKYADIAMYKAKSKDGNCCIMFTETLLDEYDLEDKINEAIINKEFATYYQPIYNLSTNKIDSAEALVRWHSPTGIIPPNDFIPTAKRSGSIIEIDKLVFADSCALCNDWHTKYGEHIIVSINISYGLLIKEDFTDFVLSTIKEHNIPSKFIKLEITEDEIIEDIAYVISVLANLRRLGFLVALDDFGIGYSSFSYIKKLPLDTIKIDRSLILAIENDKKTLSIIKTLISLSKSLGLEVICEGIEDKNQLDLLDSLGCDKIQGFLFSKAILKDDLYNYVDNFKTP